MHFGLDENNKRIMPSFSGQRAKCECCSGDLVAHCGDIRIKHWQHLNIDKDCDPWQEHETQWHRDWKSKFPTDWQEVVMEVNNEIHRADVKTKFGIVIEFQNSSIQSTTIRIRESFYGNMIWVINAKEFSQNFKLYSTVKNRLLHLDLTTDNTFSEVEKSYDNLEKSNRVEIKNIEDKILNLKWKIDENNNKILYHNPIDEVIEKLTSSILTTWKDDKSFYDYQLDRMLLEKIEELYKLKLTTLYQNLKSKQNERNNIKNNVTTIERLESVIIDSIPMKILEYEQIPKEVFERVKAILPETKNTFFPKTISFNTEAEFQAIGYRKNQYIFAISHEQSIDKYCTELKELDIEITIIENSILEASLLISETIKKEFQRVRETSSQLIVNFESEMEKFNEDKLKCYARIERLKVQRQTEIQELTKEQEAEVKSKRSQIMTKFKGLYHFDWKHQRPSWNVSKKTIYFDTGKEFLLEKVSDEQVRKINKLDFVKKLMTNHNVS